MLAVLWTRQFKKDYKKAMRQGLPIELLDQVIRLLAAEQTLPAQYRDHQLAGN